MPGQRRIPSHTTFEEFLVLASEESRAEWVEGRLEMMSPASTRHQRIAKFLIGITSAYVEQHRLGEVFCPLLCHLDHSAREPDLVFVKRESHSRARPTHLEGAPDLVAEIVSPESVDRDRRVKRIEYQEAGIREYWLIDPLAETAEFLWLHSSSDGEKGSYQAQPTSPEGIYRSRELPGFWLRTSWLWQEPPSFLNSLRELGVQI